MSKFRWVGYLRGLAETFVLKFYGLLGPRVFSSRYFEFRYRMRRDPWGYEISPYEQRKYQQTLSILPRAGYERALEVGCSIGVFTEKLAESGLVREIVGVDISEAALERARQRLARFEKVRLLRQDIIRDALEGPFDLIFCAEILYYLGTKNLKIVREKLLAALGEGGHLILVNPWPLARAIRAQFLSRPELVLIQEDIEQKTHRPYAITLLEKRLKVR